MVAKNRKFFRHTITAVVLSADVPLEWDDLGDVAYAIDQGDCVGVFREDDVEELTAEQAVQALYDMGSEPAFFNLDEEE